MSYLRAIRNQSYCVFCSFLFVSANAASCPVHCAVAYGLRINRNEEANRKKHKQNTQFLFFFSFSLLPLLVGRQL